MEVGIALFTVAIVLLSYYIYKKIRQPFDTIVSWGIESIPCYPLIGNFTWNQGPYDRGTFQKYKHKRVIALHGFRTPHMMVMDRDLIKRIMVRDFHAFSERLLLAIAPPPLNKSVFSLAGDHWKHVRGSVSPTFTTGKLKAMSGLLDRAANNALEYLEKLDHQEPVDAKDFFTRFTSDAVASTLFGLDMNSHEKKDHPFIKRAMESFNVTISNPWLVLSLMIPELVHIFTRFGSFLMRVGALDYYRKIVEHIMKDVRDSPDNVHHDFIHTMARKEIEESECDRTSSHPIGHFSRWSQKGLTKDEILSQGVAFMAAGFETTASTLRMLAYCLATHPDIQEKVRREIEDVIGDGDVTYDDLGKFPYLDMCIQETLRVYPPANRIERICNQTIDLDGIVIPKGTLVMIPLYALGMDPEHFPDPDVYNPDNFSPEKKATRHPFTYIPFGVGPRHCIGERLAWQEMRLLMVKILQKYTIEPNSDTKIPEELDYEYTGIIRVNSPLRLRMVPL